MAQDEVTAEFVSAEKTLNLHDEKLHQPGTETPFPELFAFVPWRHHVEIITKCKSVDEALFYVRKTAEEGWSRSTLQNDPGHHKSDGRCVLYQYSDPGYPGAASDS